MTILLAETFSSFEASGIFPAVATTKAIAQILNLNGGAAAFPNMGLLRIRVVNLTAVQTQFGLVKPLTVGTATTPIIGALVSRANFGIGNNVASGRLAGVAGWSVDPTYAVTPVYTEQDLLPATIGAGFEWTWPDDDPYQIGLTRNGSAQDVGLVLRNLNGGASAQVLISVRWREFSPPEG